jgi:hypothetical protein
MRGLAPWLEGRVRTERELVGTLQVAAETSSIRPTVQQHAAA